MSDFNEIPPWVCWLAKDEDGCWWGYQVEPNRCHNGWYENEVGDSIKLGFELENIDMNIDWVSSLRRIE